MGLKGDRELLDRLFVGTAISGQFHGICNTEVQLSDTYMSSTIVQLNSSSRRREILKGVADRMKDVRGGWTGFLGVDEFASS